MAHRESNEKFDKLNSLLKNEALNLPPYRQIISKGRSNLHWLKKHVLPKLLNNEYPTLKEEDRIALIELLS